MEQFKYIQPLDQMERISRTELGEKLDEILDKAKISRSHLSSIEAPNIVRPFSLEVLYNIADALDINPADLLNTTLPSSRK